MEFWHRGFEDSQCQKINCGFTLIVEDSQIQKINCGFLVSWKSALQNHARSARKFLGFLAVIRAETVQKRGFFECGFSQNLIAEFWHRGFNCGKMLIVEGSVWKILIVD